MATAEANLGSMYLNGFGVTRDVAQARSWLEKAAVQGNPNAKARLALLEQQDDSPNQAAADSGGDASERSSANRPAGLRQ